MLCVPCKEKEERKERDLSALGLIKLWNSWETYIASGVIGSTRFPITKRGKEVFPCTGPRKLSGWICHPLPACMSNHLTLNQGAGNQTHEHAALGMPAPCAAKYRDIFLASIAYLSSPTTPLSPSLNLLPSVQNIALPCPSSCPRRI